MEADIAGKEEENLTKHKDTDMERLSEKKKHGKEQGKLMQKNIEKEDLTKGIENDIKIIQ